MSSWHWTLVSVFLGSIVIALVGSVVARRRRHRALQGAADRLGLAFHAEEPDLPGRLGATLELFRRGRGRRARNVMQGEIADLGVRVLDYEYSTGSGRNRKFCVQTVVLFERTGRGLPAFEIRPENLLLRIAAALGARDIDLPEHPEFSRRCVLRGPNEAAIRAVLTSPFLDAVAGTARLCVAGGGPWFAVWRHRRRAAPDRIGAVLEEAFTICTHLDAGS